MNPAWPQRAPKVGKDYGARWRKERSPYYAEDFDWTYFNAAPADQRLPGYLRGDEPLVFQNLHPTAQVFEARACPGSDSAPSSRTTSSASARCRCTSTRCSPTSTRASST